MPRLEGRRGGRSRGEPLGGEPHTPAQVSRGARSRPGASESPLRCSRRPRPWAGHSAVTPGPRCPRTCVVPRPPRRLSGSRGGGEAHQLGEMPGIIPAHASPWLAQPPRSLLRRGAQAAATRRPEMPIFSARLNFLPAHKLRAPPPSGTVAAPQNLRALLEPPRGGGKDLAFRLELSRLPRKHRSQTGREGTGPARGAGTEATAREFGVSRLSALRSPQRPTWAFWCASRSGTALQPPRVPALLGNRQLGSQ